jgi:hypothetical protein
MKQILAIFKKDARHLWPEILASLAMLAALAYFYPDQWRNARGYEAHSFSPGGLFSHSRDFLSGCLIVLVPLSWFVLISRLVHVERLVGNTQFWVTRPYQWAKLLAAKALFIGVFLYVPFLIAQCALLAEAGFNPLTYIPGLFLNFIFATFILVLPLGAFSSLTSSFGKVILLLLALIFYIAAAAWIYSQLPFEFTSGPSGPIADLLSFISLICGFSAVVFVQYAIRRTRLAWMLLAALCVLLTALAFVNPDRWLMARHFPVQSANASGEVEFNYAGTATHEPSVVEAEEKGVLDISVPVSAGGFNGGIAIQPVALKASLDAPGGAHWESPWQSVYAGYLAANRTDFTPDFKMRRADYDRFRSTAVTLSLILAVNKAKPIGTIQMQLQPHDFSVPRVGICLPQNPQYFSDPGTITGLNCRSAMRAPQLTYVTVHWSDDDCPDAPSSANSIAGDGWVGSLDTSPADFGITSVWLHPLFLSNATGEFHPGEPLKVRHLCPGSQLAFTTYESIGSAQVNMTIENFRLPAPSKVQVLGLTGVLPK